MKMWKGVILEESLEDKSLLKLVKIVNTHLEKLENEDRVLTFHKIELEDKNIEEFITKAESSIKDAFYLHITKDNELIVIFKNKTFFCKTLVEMRQAREYGIERGIIQEQMPFERLVMDPWS